MIALRNRDSFELLKLVIAVCIIALMVACSSVQTSTFNEQAAITMRSVTAARDTSTALLQGKKITLEQDAKNQAKLDAIVEGVKQARINNDVAKVQALRIEVEAVK